MQVILDVLEMGLKIKKTPVVVGNCTGFAVNRIFFPYTMAACMLVDLGIDPYMVDAVIKGFGMPMGPFRLSDLVRLPRLFSPVYPDAGYNYCISRSTITAFLGVVLMLVPMVDVWIKGFGICLWAPFASATSYACQILKYSTVSGLCRCYSRN